MLNVRQKKYLPLLIFLSFSLNSFAETGLHEKTSLSKKSALNLVELYKVKVHATEHIRGIEAKLLATDEDDQEELLVELAQSLLYYNDRHNKEDDKKAATSKEVSSRTTSLVNGKVSKNVNAKKPYSSHNIYRKALNAYKKASKLSLNKNRIKYTRELSELAIKLQNKNELVQVFDELLQHGGDETGTYLAHVDYADGLAKFKDKAAEAQFLSAVNMRIPVDGVEANFRYANYLLDNNKPREALNVLDKFSFDERKMYVHIAMLRQKIMHLLKMDTQEVDGEIKGLRQNLSKSPFIKVITKFTSSVNKTPTNILELSEAYAFTFSHKNKKDDSRGRYHKIWIPISFMGHRFSTFLINAAEVVYNESRGDKYKARIAVAWAIRNRALIDMNNCSSYPGSEGHISVNSCRSTTPSGPSSSLSEIFRRYSCVVHGGTTSVGAFHSEMDDSHVDIGELASSGIIWEMLYVINGWVPDPTGSDFFFPKNNRYPDEEIFTGNPEGAQEWRRNNYCAEKAYCKIRLGNVGGNLPDPGVCTGRSKLSIDNFFWGRNPNNNKKLPIE